METTESRLTGIKFKRNWLSTFALITMTGKFTVKVLGNVTEKNLYTDENGRQRYIVGLRATTPDQKPQLQAVFADGVEEVDIEQTNGLFLTAAIWKKDENDQPTLPMKGEEVEVYVDLVENREKTAKLLRVTNIKVLAAKKAENFSLTDLEPTAVDQHVADEANAIAS